MNLILVGYRGTGKSAVASKLAALLDWRVVSLDEEIVRSAGKPIPAIVAMHGWNYFRDLEEKLCREFCKVDGLILDCGGGVVEREANIALLREGGRVFWLRATPATIIGRIGGDASRPSLTGDKSFTEEVEEVLRRRTPLYERIAHTRIDTDGLGVDELAADIAQRFQAAPPVNDASRAPRLPTDGRSSGGRH
jgi:shikimate kinase